MEAGELRDNIARVRERIETVARRAGRDSGEVTLVAVSKMHPAELVAAAFMAGQRIFGENRVEEAAPKVAEVVTILREQGHREPAPEWHMIGHLQSRKAGDVLPWSAMVQSVDGEKLARRLNRFAEEAGYILPVLLEVNVSGEESKYGSRPEEVLNLAPALLELPCLDIQGLMTMAPMTDDPESVRPVFAGLRGLRDELAARHPTHAWRHLSMGMTDDFEVAIEEGATIIRIGRAIFGERACALK